MLKHPPSLSLLVLVILLAPLGLVGQTTITTVAGSAGQGPVATALSLRSPRAVAIDGAGNVYIADTESHRVRRLTSGGAVSVLAGNGTPGAGGDGGPAVEAQLFEPSGVAVDSAGNVYIADTGNHRIRRVTPGGVISTVAGGTVDQLNLPAGVAVEASGAVLIADTGNHRIRRWAGGGLTTVAGTGLAGFSGDGGAATNAQLWSPRGVAFDAGGTMWIADRFNRRVRQVSPGGIISTVAGTGAAGFSGDGGAATAASFGDLYAIAVHPGGGVVVADASSHRVRRVNGGTISTVGGNGTPTFAGDGGAAVSASLSLPYGVCVDGNGTIWVADSANGRVRRISAAGVMATVAGNGQPGFAGDGADATSAQLFHPAGLAVDGAGNLYIADSENNRVRRVTPGGTVTTVAGNGGIFHSGDGGQATAATLYRPSGVAVDATGNLFIADTFNNRVRRVTPGGVISTVAGGGTSPADGIAATSAQLILPSAVAVDNAGNVFVADYSYRVRQVNAGGMISTVAGTGVAGLGGEGGSALAAQLQAPNGLARDAAGNLYVADGSRIRRITPGGIISTMAGGAAPGSGGDGGGAVAAGLNQPFGLAVDGAGSLYLADSANHRLREVNAAGVIRTVAGTGVAGFGGDGGDPSSSSLYDPRGVAIDGSGRILVADTRNQRVRRLTVTPTTSFATSPAGLTLIVNGTSYTAPFSLNLPAGTSMTVEAPAIQNPPGARAVFANWSDGASATRTIVLGSASATYTANYTTQFALTRAVNPANGGTLTATPSSADGFYPAGTTLTLTATPSAGYAFSGFSGDLSGGSSPQNLLLSAARNVTANFVCTYQLGGPTTVNVSSSAGSGTLTVATGAGCPVSLVPQVSWLSANLVGNTITYSFQANTGFARSGVLLVAGQTVTVNQAIAPSMLTPSARDGGPIAPAGNSQVIVARYSHPAGVDQLGVVNVLINRALDGGNACYIAYSRPAGILFLVNDGGPASGLSAPLVLGAPGSVSNSQCTVSGPGSSAVSSGNGMTLTLAISFSNTFRGNRVIYLAAQSVTNVTSGWQTMGASILDDAAVTFPRPVAMSPATSTAATQTLSLTYQDATSVNNLQTVWALMNTALDARGSCYIAYFVPANLVFLFPDDGNGANVTVMELSGSNSLENSYCRIQAQGSSTVRSGNQLTLNLNYTVKPAFAGPRGVWAALQTLSAQTSPWKIVGAWLVP